MIYITGDTHRDFSRLKTINYTKDDMIIVLGDAGINFYLEKRDKELKEYLNSLGIKLFCIRGNHDARPQNINTYKEVNMFGGKVYVESDYPNLIFASDGEEYNINGNSVLVIGGAYSIDKVYRIIHNLGWFSDEQLSPSEMDRILEKVSGKHYDVILSHTCPYKYEPIEAFIGGINQFNVDKSMEHFLDIIEDRVDYDKWYCGHYHIEKKIDKIEFMYGNIKKFYKKELKKELIKE